MPHRQYVAQHGVPGVPREGSTPGYTRGGTLPSTPGRVYPPPLCAELPSVNPKESRKMTRRVTAVTLRRRRKMTRRVTAVYS